MVEISTSVLNIENDEKTTQNFYDIELAKTDYFHIDVMDGIFVKNDSTKQMLEYINIIKHISNVPLDVHLMVKNIFFYITEYLEYEPNIITFHIEAIEDKEEAFKIINFLKENKIKIGIAIKPNTEIEKIVEFLPYIHVVLVMTVEPGYGGQKFIMKTLEKIKQLKTYIEENFLDIDIEVDGGINIETSRLVQAFGANLLVCGNSIITSKNKKDTIKKLKKEGDL